MSLQVVFDDQDSSDVATVMERARSLGFRVVVDEAILVTDASQPALLLAVVPDGSEFEASKMLLDVLVWVCRYPQFAAACARLVTEMEAA